jgi:hypothetical protein
VAARIERQRTGFVAARGQQPGFHQDLKSIANSQDQSAAFDEAVQRIGEPLEQAPGQDATGGNIIAVAESARNGQDGELIEQPRLGDQRANVDDLRSAAGLLPGVRGFVFAVDPRWPATR